MAEMMYSLPSDIKTEIFSQLPVNSIIQCKRVCKTWRACVHELLNDPSFINSHTQRLLSSSSSPTTDAASSFTSFLAREKHSKPGNQFHIVGSCNGLVCLVDNNYNAYICNPVTFTREYVNLPATPQKECGNKIIAIGFGYLPSTNEYKFVKIAFDGIRKIYVSVYTLGRNGKWSIKELQDDSYGDLRHVTIATAAGFHSNGVICWNTITSSLSPYGNIIISFNLKSKKLAIVRSRNDEEMCMLGRRICYIRTQVRTQEICLRNRTRIDLIRIKPELEKDFTPPFALEEKIFLSYDYMKFVSYDSSHSQIVDWVEILLPYMSKFEVIPYMMSLVSIRALGESTCVVARKRN